MKWLTVDTKTLKDRRNGYEGWILMRLLPQIKKFTKPRRATTRATTEGGNSALRIGMHLPAGADAAGHPPRRGVTGFGGCGKAFA